MSTKLHSLDDLGYLLTDEESFSQRNKNKFRILSNFKIEYEKLDDIEILEESKEYPIYIYAINKKTNELIYATIKIFQNRHYKNAKKFVLYQATKSNDVVHEKYYDIPNNGLDLKWSKKQLKNMQLKNNNLIFERAYTDVNTKYGDFCLVLQKDGNPKYNYFGKNSSIGLYHGSSEKIIEPDSSLESTYYLVFKNTANEHKFYNYMIGHNYGTVIKHMWAYNLGKYIYSNGNVGSIIEDGNINILDNKYREGDYCPYIVYNLVDDYNKYLNNDVESKAYFRIIPLSFLAIEKQKKNINIKLITTCALNEPKKVMDITIPSQEEGKFTPKEIDMIIDALDAQKGTNFFTYISKDKYEASKKMLDPVSEFSEVKQCLIDYKKFIENINSKKFDITSPYCLPIKYFNKATSILRNSNKKEIVETIIDRYIEEFNISIEKLLGNKKSALEYMQNNLEYKKKINYVEPFKKY